MRPFLTSLLLIVLTIQLHGQTNRVLSTDGQKQLWQIYQHPQSAYNTLTHQDEKHSIESEYLHLYSLFISFQANEKVADANTFHEQLNWFEDNFSMDNRFHLMYSTLLIQQSLLFWNNEAFTDGMRSFYKAHRYFEKADSSKFTEDYQKLNGLFEIFFSQIPQQYQFWASLFGLQGDSEKGFRLLKENLSNTSETPGSNHEAAVLYSYCLLKFGEIDTDEIRELIQSTEAQQSPVLVFTLTSLCIKNQMGDEGIHYITSVPEEFYAQFPLLYYTKGRLLLNLQDTNCMSELNRFLSAYEGQSFRTDALLRGAWWLHIHQRNDECDSLLFKIAQQNKLPTSNDKQAQKEAESLKDEPIALLKARLLFDGGYFQQALSSLSNLDTTTLGNYYLAEYHYRKGRIHQELNQAANALLNYNEVIALCRDDKRYIGPYAAIEAAGISLEQQQYEIAKTYLQQASELNDGQYKSDINAKIIQLKNLCEAN